MKIKVECDESINYILADAANGEKVWVPEPEYDLFYAGRSLYEQL